MPAARALASACTEPVREGGLRAVVAATSVARAGLRREARREIREIRREAGREIRCAVRREVPCGGSAGFTLVEMLVVLMMLGIAAAVAVPAFRPPAERSAGAAARALRSVYADARSEAARRGVAVAVEIETATGSWRMATDPVDGTAPQTLKVGTLPLPAEGRITGGEGGTARAVFGFTGRARAHAVAIGESAERHVVTVDGWTGATTHDAR